MAPPLIRKAARGETPRCTKPVNLTSLCLVAAGLVLAGCEGPRPLTFTEFMEDDFARDGTLARCNADRQATAGDIECANARRAAMAIALREERARREELEAESERLRAELRTRIAQQQEAERRAREAAEIAERVAYDAQWADPDSLERPPDADLVIEHAQGAEDRSGQPQQIDAGEPVPRAEARAPAPE